MYIEFPQEKEKRTRLGKVQNKQFEISPFTFFICIKIFSSSNLSALFFGPSSTSFRSSVVAMGTCHYFKYKNGTLSDYRFRIKF